MREYKSGSLGNQKKMNQRIARVLEKPKKENGYEFLVEEESASVNQYNISPAHITFGKTINVGDELIIEDHPSKKIPLGVNTAWIVGRVE
jgi:hypothetical protein